MNNYKHRLIESKIKEKLELFGGVLIQGARGVGKTTTALTFAKSFIRLDINEETKQLASISPKVILSGDTPRLIDEWQIVPSIWNVIRHEIDDRSLKGRGFGQFLLSGSAAPSDNETRHSGAMRISRVSIDTMSLSESENSSNLINFADLFKKNMKVSGISNHTLEDYIDFIIRGGWPQLISLPPDMAIKKIKDYVTNVSSVDLRTLEHEPNPIRVAALIRALSRNIATNASLETLANETKISRQTIRKYLDQLTQIFILNELQSWNTHIRSSVRAKITPKWFFLDPSIGIASLDLNKTKLLNDLKTLGFYFESLAIRDLRTYAHYLDGEIYFFQDSNGLDIDAIIELPDESWAAFEIKLGGDDFIKNGIHNFELLKTKIELEKWKKCMSLNIITATNISLTREDGINIIALGHLFVK